MKKLLLFLTLTFIGVSSVSIIDIFSPVLVREQWETFKLRYNKRYENLREEESRREIYIENLHKIEVHNQKYELGLVPFRLAMNQFGDMFAQEVVSKRNGFNKNKLRNHNKTINEDNIIKYMPPANVKLPESIDWRKLGAVTPIKDQGECGSCWCFSATGSLEGQHYRQTRKLVSLSEQNLVDCSTNDDNIGCGGGMVESAFKYIQQNHGIDTEESYPYEATQKKCRYNPKTRGADDKGYTSIESGSEEDLQAAVGVVGPISVAIDAQYASFHFYSDGIYEEPECSTTKLDHAVLVIGYGTTDNGTDYWLVKNSWGTKWGKEGYMLMARNKNNMCGVATDAVFPLV